MRKEKERHVHSFPTWRPKQRELNFQQFSFNSCALQKIVVDRPDRHFWLLSCATTRGGSSIPFKRENKKKKKKALYTYANLSDNI